MSNGMSEPIIRGKKVALRPSAPDDVHDVHIWCNESDVTPSMAGPPTFPDKAPSDNKEFCVGYESYYWDGSEPMRGRVFIIRVGGAPIGAVGYNEIDPATRRVELDIWMNCEASCGKGYGPDALGALCAYLVRSFDVEASWMQPSARNPRAIRAYEKAGFRRVDITPEEMQEQYGARDYHDSVLMILPASHAT